MQARRSHETAAASGTTTGASLFRLVVLAAGLLLLLLTMVACGPEPTPSPTPTKTLRPTFTPTSAEVAQATQTAVALAQATPTPTSTSTATPVPTDTPTPTDTPEPPTPTPTDTPVPTNTPQPRPTSPPAPPPPPTPTPAPVVEDPCANIGGDGCKFRLTQGPAFADNGGNELKLQFLFIHSGVAGGQPQGSYFIWLEKDGVKLPVSDGTRSVALESSEGRLGRYNYEYKLGLDVLPGNSVAGSYRIWVLDGNGERDSQTFEFSVPAGQGEVWAVFDQA